MSRDVARIQLDGAAIVGLALGPFPLVQGNDAGQRRMRLGQTGLEIEIPVKVTAWEK